MNTIGGMIVTTLGLLLFLYIIIKGESKKKANISCEEEEERLKDLIR